MIAWDQVWEVTDERLDIRIYDALKTHPRLNDVFSQSEQKRAGNKGVNSGKISGGTVRS